MKTLEEAGNSSPLRLYLSGATPPLFHFANRTSAAPLRLTRCSRVAAAADAPKGEADGSDPAKFDARSSGSSSAASASPKTPADARRTPAFRPRGLSTPGTPASPLVATTSASAPCECPQPPAAVAPPAPPLKHGDRLRALGGAVESKMPATPSESEAETELVYKIMVVGNAACGKTSIINRFVNNVFSETCAPRLSPPPPPCCRSRPWPHCPYRSST